MAKSKKVAKKLMLFDHDGTLCDTNKLAYESLESSFSTTVKQLNIDISSKVDWEKAFTETTGTTEKNLVRYLCYSYGIPFGKAGVFEDRFYYNRAA